MFLEYCQDGDLKEYIKKKENKMLSEPEAVKFFKHIVEGFKELHRLKIIHRDIKPANILLSEGRAKLSDFGFSRVLENLEDAKTHSFVGSPLYMAPEILSEMPFSSKCDVWSAGIMLFEILYGKTPWIGTSQINLYENVRDQPLQFPKEPVRSAKVKNLLKKMLVFHEKDRISWPELFEDILITENKKILEESMRRQHLQSGALEKSLIQNDAYVQQNLVATYLMNVEEDADQFNLNQEKQQQKNTLNVPGIKYMNNNLNINKNANPNQKNKDQSTQNPKKLSKEQEIQFQVKDVVKVDENDDNDFGSDDDKDQIVTDENSDISNNELKQIQIRGKDLSTSFKNNSNLNTVHESTQDSVQEKKDFCESQEENYDHEDKAQKLIKAQMDADKMRKNILKVNEYILYERNVSFFYNFVIQKIISACNNVDLDNSFCNNNSIQIPPLLYFRVVLLISKCQNTNLQKISMMMSSPTSEFQQNIWDSFQSSLDYLKTQKLLVQDIWFAKKFYSELLKKTNSLIDDALKNEPTNQNLLQFKPILNSRFVSDQGFKSVYKNTLNEFINYLKQSTAMTNNKDILVVLKYLLTCLNPYSVFDKTDFDFSQFYEKISNDPIEQLKKEVL